MKQVVQQDCEVSIQKLSDRYPVQLTAIGPVWAGGLKHPSPTIL